MQSSSALKKSNVVILPANRQRQMSEYIVSHGSAQIGELADKFDISEATVRRDLDDIEKSGLVRRTHGGAIAYNNNISFDKEYEDKLLLNESEKHAIAKYAADLVLDGDTIILDSGTTARALAVNLEGKQKITVITNDLHIALNTSLHPSSSLIILPGVRVPLTKVTVGYYAERFLQSVQANKFFMTADAVDSNAGITNANVDEVGIKCAMVNAAHERILLADSSKFDKQALFSVAQIKSMNKIITNKTLPEDSRRKYARMTELILV